MGIVTSEAGELFLTLLKAAALCEIQRLVAGVPGVFPLGGRAHCVGLPVACSALIVDGSGSIAGRIFNAVFGSTRLDMRSAWPVTDLAIHTRFRRLDAIGRIHSRQPGRVATEAAQDLGLGLEDAVFDPIWIVVSWGRSKRSGGTEPALPVFEVVSVVEVAYPGNGMSARAEGPIGLWGDARCVCRCLEREGKRVAAGGMGSELLCVAGAATLRPQILSRGWGGAKEQEAD